MRSLMLLAQAGMLTVAALWGQTPIPPPVGVVTGHVVCADTQRPARFARVILLLKPDQAELFAFGKAVQNGTYKPAPPQDPTRQPVTLLEGRTGADGAFAIPGVSPGTYYVLATLPGYRTLVHEEQGDDLSKLMEGVKEVRVAPDKAASAEVVLERGGTIAGRARFEDGTAVAGTSVSWSRYGTVKKLRDVFG